MTAEVQKEIKKLNQSMYGGGEDRKFGGEVMAYKTFIKGPVVVAGTGRYES